MIKELVSVERKIVIGMITNTKFLKQALTILETEWMQSKEARTLTNWVSEYFHKFKKAPNQDIQEIYFEKLRKKKISKEQAQIIEQILESLSSQSEDEQINMDYLMELTQDYCKACKVSLYAEEMLDQLEDGNVLEAEQMMVNYNPVEIVESKAASPLSNIKQIRTAFESMGEPLLKYPGALGSLLNPYMIKEGFVIFLGQNKIGKSWILFDAAMRAANQGKKVVFFQAGDMSQAQLERRGAIYLSKKSDMRMYCGDLMVPILDCCHNQNNSCELPYREGGIDRETPFENVSAKKIRAKPYNKIKETFEDYYDHVPCYNCLRKGKQNRFLGTVWYKIRKEVEPLTWKDTYRIMKTKYKKLMQRIKIITYPSDSLTMSKIFAETDLLERTGFIPDVHIIDYMDIISVDRSFLSMKPNDQENQKYKMARRFSQEKKSLVLSASQSDAQGFEVKFLKKSNFSTDRRKLDHVTAMVGLNMTHEEKKKGLMRINDIAARETIGADYVHVMHRLQIGRPVLGSFY